MYYCSSQKHAKERERERLDYYYLFIVTVYSLFRYYENPGRFG
jgi:hypothetical protein